MKWARHGALVPAENKQQAILLLDADVLIFYKDTGKRYQSRINAALREYRKARRKQAVVKNWLKSVHCSIAPQTPVRRGPLDLRAKSSGRICLIT